MIIRSSISPVVRQCIFVIAANLSTLTVGLCLGWSSPVLVKLNSNSTVLSRPITEEEGTWIVSIIQLTCVLFVIIGSPIIDCLGRKYTIFLACIPKITAGLLLIFSTEVWEVILARFCDGVSVAITYVVISTYTAEIADKNIRGSLGAIIQIFRSVGVVSMFCVGPFLSYEVLHYTYIGLIVVSVIPIVFLPESPYFLYSKGKIEESEKILHSLRRTKQEVQEELKMYADNKHSKEIKMVKLLKNRTFLIAVAIAFVFSGVGPCCGFNFVAFYLQNIMTSTGTSIKPEMASVVVGIVQLVACVCPLFVTDRFGRKPILIVTLLIVAVGMIGLGTFFWCKQSGYEIGSFLDILPLLSAAIINFGHNSGYGSIFFVLIPELFTGPQRSRGVSMSFLIMSLSTFAVTKSYAVLLSSIGPAASYWMFSGICCVFCTFVIFCVPETKGKMFHEIQEALGGKVLKKDAVVSAEVKI